MIVARFNLRPVYTCLNKQKPHIFPENAANESKHNIERNNLLLYNERFFIFFLCGLKVTPEQKKSEDSLTLVTAICERTLRRNKHICITTHTLDLASYFENSASYISQE